jgi:hypothetical protein
VSSNQQRCIVKQSSVLPARYLSIEPQSFKQASKTPLIPNIQIELMNYALFATPAPRNDKSIKLFNSSQLLSLPGQIINVDLGAETTVSSRRLGRTSQLLKSVEVLICKGVGADRAEGGGRASAGGEELEWMEG